MHGAFVEIKVKYVVKRSKRKLLIFNIITSKCWIWDKSNSNVEISFAPSITSNAAKISCWDAGGRRCTFICSLSFLWQSAMGTLGSVWTLASHSWAIADRPCFLAKLA